MQTTFKTGDLISLEIDQLTLGGEGLGKKDGFTVFVPNGFPGDQAEVELITVRPNYGRGLIKTLNKPSEGRVEPKCNVIEACGGCQWQQFDYAGQLKQKQKMLPN